MIIKSSNVAMNSSRSFQKVVGASASVITGSIGNGSRSSGTLSQNQRMSGDAITISEKSREMLKKMRTLQRENRVKNNLEKLQTPLTAKTVSKGVKSEDEVMLQTLKRILETLRQARGGKKFDFSKDLKSTLNDLIDRTFGSSENASSGFGTGISGVWVKQTVASSFMSEQENTAFTGVGTAVTADGRELNFGVTVEMSRSFMEQNEFISEEAGYIFTDPLVINLDSNAASVSDQKFLFDLDADGKEEQISFADQGSGFLALDKNEDGKINDGSELFGTKSGDGFKDLSVYDKDHNGWIDEADEVFSKLRIYTKDENGNDKLIDLKSAGVGALYLGHVSSEFSLNQLETNQTNGVIRSTGMYLKENGEAGTLQHVDLAV
ncbi:MAG: hypothetical protein GX567_14750 [Clostridia bacterium]|nr:hypothetical protein [Clostridia bacterium]